MMLCSGIMPSRRGHYTKVMPWKKLYFNKFIYKIQKWKKIKSVFINFFSEMCGFTIEYYQPLNEMSKKLN